jgi:hypothetical protein
MSETVIKGSMDIWRTFARTMERNHEVREAQYIIEAEVEQQAREEELERVGLAPNEIPEAEGQEVELRIGNLENEDDGEDDGYEVADEEFAQRHHIEDDAIDVVIAMS